MSHRLLLCCFALALVGLLVGACGQEDSPAATPTTEPPAQAASRKPCGDGVCDEAEQANPQLCPQDCPQLPPTDEPTAPSSPLPPTPTSKPTGPTPTPDPCGDGVCDETEQKDTTLCPQDCPTPTPEAAVTVEVTPAEPTTVPTKTPPPEPTQAVVSTESVRTPAGELAFVGDPATVSQEGAGAAEQPQSNVALILDGSGSMGEALPGTGKTKLAVAKEVMAELIPQIPTELNGALWIYAHRHPPEPKAESCQDVEQVYALGPVVAADYVESIQGIQANGWTPIADSIIAAAESLPPGDYNSIILVSDGEETCGGDPCAVAEALKASKVGLTVHVVGYAVDDATREQLECTAQVSGGTYHDALDAEGLLDALEEALAATVVETILRVEIVGPDGAQVNGDVLLYEAGTDRKVSYYRAWKDNSVPPGLYDLLASTLPPTFYSGLELPEGSTTVVRIVLGSLSVFTPEGEQVAAGYYEASIGERLGYYGHDGPVALAPGSYYVEVNESASSPVVVQPGEAGELVMGTIAVLTPEGEPIAAEFWNATTAKRLGSYGSDGPASFVPASYYVEIHGSSSAPIALESGQATELNLGGIVVLTPEGEAVAAEFYDAATKNRLGAYGDEGPALFVPGSYIVDMHGSRTDAISLRDGQRAEVQLGAVQVDGSFTIWDADGNRLGAYSDTMLLVPGTFRLELADGTAVGNVVVVPGEVTQVE